MKRACKIILAAGALAVAACCIFGCASVNCENSDTAEFPTVEKWWK